MALDAGKFFVVGPSCMLLDVQRFPGCHLLPHPHTHDSKNVSSHCQMSPGDKITLS